MLKNYFIQRDGKTVIYVERGIRYMSEWTDFNLNFFNGPYIINKQIPGCGFTEYCLTNNNDIILASPRKILLANKENQHPGEIFYARNEFEKEDLGVDKDISIPNKQSSEPDEENEAKRIHNELCALEKMEEKLMNYISSRLIQRKPMKLIVTYDSFHHVREILEKNSIFKPFKIVVDEFQSVFVDSRFKASTEFGFMNELKQVNNDICFVSATPMMDKYLKQIDYFKNLPYYELDWGFLDPGRVIKPELKVRKIKSVCFEIKRIIEEYLKGEFAILANPVTSELVQSTEAVFYVNSVNDILKVIKTMGLTPDQVNILCSDTTINRRRIQRKLGKKFEIGSVPLRGEPHKMFTFCTRTVYLGADFYSTNARSFILSDANIDSLAVDISLDLPQILGRQRLAENPWKNHAEFYFKTLGKEKDITEDAFNSRVKSKLESTNHRISLFMKGTDTEQKAIIGNFRDSIVLRNYSNDYISINYNGGREVPVLNNLVLVAEQRAYDIQQIDYKDRFSVFNTINESDGFKMDKISRFVEYLRDTTYSIPIRLKALCETDEFSEDEKRIIAQQASENFDKYYNLLGPERCRAVGYDTTRIRKEISDMMISEEDVKVLIMEKFLVGKRYTNVFIKEELGKIYSQLKLARSPKASDIDLYLETKPVKILDQNTQKRIHGLEIIKIK